MGYGGAVAGAASHQARAALMAVSAWASDYRQGWALRPSARALASRPENPKGLQTGRGRI